MAAVSGVAASLQAVDMVVKGECVSAFCATRPPGHHAGRELRAMNAVSNGFCLLNNAACAALYAVTPRNEGGRGLKRVCIIDFDVHHGNGTQDILCSTYDSRFFYVSLHAGGAHINGFETNGSDSEDQDFRRILGGSKQDGIYPGRCGDHSPHSGVLNIPLGPKVTAHAIGTALMTEVAPAVEAFSPDLIILSSGFDAHKHDPMGLGSLSAEDFGSVTDVACQMAMKVCSGRVVSVLEGGYGVPCCQPSAESFIPPKYLDLGKDVPEGMMDDVSDALKQKLEKCYSEGFLDCVKAHVTALSRSSRRQ
jgi:acetoin utilization deacetylase AcuC-like enzyme